MLSIDYIRENHERVAEFAKAKGVDLDVGRLLELDEQRRQLIAQAEGLRAERNELASATKGAKPDEAQVNRGRVLREELDHVETELAEAEARYRELMAKVPNVPTDDTPTGAGEAENQVLRTVGEPTKFDFKPKSHVELGEARGLIDKERAAKVSGARFTYLKGGLVRLQFALIQLTMQELTNSETLATIAKKAGLDVSDKPFELVIPPVLVRTEAYEATARLAAEETTYKIEGEELWLAASAEHSLVNMHMGETFEEDDLPRRYLGYSSAFRREAGSYGKDTEGILRLHQFDKLEMESFTTAEQSRAEHDFMIAIQEHLMQLLELPYQLVIKCTGDMGGPNARAVDIETWLPGQDTYRETHTADYMTDYQARRLQTKVQYKGGRRELVHTNDATAFAAGRTLIAIMENYQTKDGTIRVPEALQPFMGGQDSI